MLTSQTESNEKASLLSRIKNREKTKEKTHEEVKTKPCDVIKHITCRHGNTCEGRQSWQGVCYTLLPYETPPSFNVKEMKSCPFLASAHFRLYLYDVHRFWAYGTADD